MGMDLSGVKPTKKAGVYLRSNLVDWLPLWSFVLEVCLDLLTEREADLGFGNNHILIRSKKAKAISQRLLSELRSPSVNRNPLTKKQAEVRRKSLRAAQSVASAVGGFLVSNNEPMGAQIREFAVFCAASGGFWID